MKQLTSFRFVKLGSETILSITQAEGSRETTSVRNKFVPSLIEITGIEDARKYESA